MGEPVLITQEDAIVIAAGFSAATSLLGYLLTSLRQSRTEKLLRDENAANIATELRKLRFEQDAAIGSEEREEIKNFVYFASSATHNMCWITWRAKTFHQDFERADLEKYDEEMHVLLPKLISSSFLVKSYQPSWSKQVAELVEDIEKYDAKIADFLVQHFQSRAHSKNSLRKKYTKVIGLHEKLEETISEFSMSMTSANLDDQAQSEDSSQPVHNCWIESRGSSWKQKREEDLAELEARKTILSQ